MKSLNKFIKESVSKAQTGYDGPDYFPNYYYKHANYKYYNADTANVTLEDIENATADSRNVTGDPSFCDVDGTSFTKIKQNQWQAMSMQQYASGKILTNKQLFDLINNGERWYAMLRFK